MGMRRYILRRVGASLLTLFVVVTLTFFMMRAIPGGPFTDERAIPAHVLENMMERYGLNDPLYVQYGRYLWNALRCDLGPSYRYEGLTVNELIADSFPVSLLVGGLALALSLLLGIPAGVLSALRRGGWQDRLAMVLATLGVAIPNFVVATVLVYFFAYQWGWVSVGFWEGLPTAILPAMTLAGYPTAFVSRLTRSSMLEVLQQDYIRTAAAKGLRERTVVYIHALRNALIPVVTYMGPLIAGILTGSFVIEKVFGVPGLGTFFVTSITNRDYTTIMGVTIFYSALLIFLNLAVDVCLGLIDPRIRMGAGGMIEVRFAETAPDEFTPLSPEERMGMEFTRPSLSYWGDAWGRLRRDRLALAGGVILLILVLAVAGPWFSPWSYEAQDFMESNEPPSLAHWFGTDMFGRDLFVRVLYGARISLAVGFMASFISLFIGVLYGGVSGLAGGRLDNLMMRVVDVIYSVPMMIYVILLMVVVGPGLRSIFITLGVSYWAPMARIVRAEVMRLKNEEFVLAASALGASNRRILLRHLLPNAMGPILVTLTFSIPGAIFTEAFLSFVGLGVSAPMASWGVLCSDAMSSLSVYPWQLFFPAAAISVTILAFNFLGDGLRDALDPRLRR